MEKEEESVLDKGGGLAGASWVGDCVEESVEENEESNFSTRSAFSPFRGGLAGLVGRLGRDGLVFGLVLGDSALSVVTWLAGSSSWLA